MRFAITLCALLLPVSWAQNSRPGEEIQKAEAAWVAAVKSADAAALQRMLADDLVYTHATGPVDTKGEYISAIMSKNRNYEGIEHSNVNVRIYGNTAVLNANMRMRGSTKGQPFDDRVRMIHVWVKQKGAWQLVAHQTTKIP